MKEDPILTNLITELKRGTLTLCVLSQLTEPQYGYSLLQVLCDKQIAIEANTLYPLLRRLESQGLLQSSWDTSEARPRKFYALSDKGRTILGELVSAWKEQTNHMHSLLGEESHA
ncbi:MAG: PadR family transcriptional regulator [Sphaerochaeta associata]|uniref:PadR family transcriptional regulator n=1 Tax=Sphaerochaeta associata TaxID=1129264 RepID=UPI002B21EB69|nr:PadR family transcriptional regulator [Sphaerochaeta associata]MEA5029006.1 PadR family transcriptional regulator [Sphaerochaeta associata]